MLRRKFQIGCLVVAAVFAAQTGVSAQRAKLAQLRQPAARNPGTPQERRMLDLPPRWIDRVRQMPPAQQQRFLGNNERFRSLPPERQAQIRRQLQTWNNLNPEQRQAVLDREQVWERMTPDQQRYVRQTLLPQWQNLPPRRRQVILQKLHDLRGLDDAQRAAKLNDEAFTANLDPNEKGLLRDLSTLRVTGPEPPE